MAQIFDPRGLTWERWCSAMAERFAANQLGTIPEQNWRKWADALAGIGRFPGVPDSRGFQKWQDWAFALNDTLRN